MPDDAPAGGGRPPGGLTRALAEFVAGVRFERLPREAVPVVCAGFADCVGVAIAGRGEPAVRIVRETLRPLVGGSGAHVSFGPDEAPAPVAAWVNGTAAHALDYDDNALRGHPSAVLVPAILAEAEELDAPGTRMLAAYVAGYEVWAELVRREREHHHEKGWHPTAVFGPVAAAAAAAVLRQAPAGVAANALAIAASQAGGVMANFGSMTKPFHVGRAASAGILAARLAAAGMTAAGDALEHPQGLLSAVSPRGAVDRESRPTALGREWRIVAQRLNIKRYPVCYAAHRSVDAMLDLVAARPFVAEDVERITVSLGGTQALMMRSHRPATGLEARFSVEFALAASVLARRLGLREVRDEFAARADVQALLRRVVVETRDDYDPDFPGYAPFDQVRVLLRDGSVLESAPVRRPRGHASNPLPPGELWAKFDDCVGDALPSPRKQALFERLGSLDRLPSARDLFD